MKIEGILTLIKAVSDSELTEFEISFDEEEEGGTGGHVTFSAKKAAKEVLMPPQMQVVPPMPAVSSMPAMPSMPSMTASQMPSGMPVPPVLSMPVFQQQADGKETGGKYITSPMVGTFYAAPSEDAQPFISVGDVVKKGQVVGIVEAMKLMNEIESPYDGVVEKILVENKAMVGFGDELVLVRTNE